MRAGSLNCLVAIESPQTTYDGAGQPTAGWTTRVSVWASIKHLSGIESIRAGQDASIVQASIRIRRRADVDQSMRVRYGLVIYAIRAVLPDEVGREFLDLVCERVNG